MRSFVAVNLPEKTKDEIGDMIERLRTASPPARWVPPQNLHVTVKFLDEIREDQVGPIIGAITMAGHGVAPFELRLGGFGFFPNEQKARVFWIGINSGFEPLRDLAKGIERQLARLGFPPEKRRFAAHITLARMREPSPVERLTKAAAHIQYQSDPIPVERIDLMQSVLSPKGATYSIIESVRLDRR